MYNKRLLALFLIITSLACSNNKAEQTTETECFDDKKISDIGTVYIGNNEYLDSIDIKSDNDILVLDQRYLNDPNIKILDSYRITDPEIMEKVLDEIIEYERDNPSDWNRTVSSMKYEWIIHNLAYSLNYEIGRSKDVDLNNKDEQKYLKKIR